jgi:pyruvate dehydrogenase E1 component alpha subunit
MLEATLAEAGILSADEAARVHAEVTEEALAAIAFAEESPMPDPSELLTDVYTVAAGGA